MVEGSNNNIPAMIGLFVLTVALNRRIETAHVGLQLLSRSPASKGNRESQRSEWLHRNLSVAGLLSPPLSQPSMQNHHLPTFFGLSVEAVGSENA